MKWPWISSPARASIAKPSRKPDQPAKAERKKATLVLSTRTAIDLGALYIAGWVLAKVYPAFGVFASDIFNGLGPFLTLAFIGATAWFTQTLSESTNQIRDGADATLAHLEESSRLELRAYLGFSILRPPQQQEFADKRKADIRHWNHGKTPARNLRFKGWYEVVDSLPSGEHPRAISEGTRGDTKPGPRTCDPTVGESLNALYDSIRSDATNGSEIASAILNPAIKRLYLYGTTLYEDVFGDWHHTDFCVQYAPDATPDPTYPWIICTCPQHNTAS